jgi:hypothetical protein
MAVLLGTGSLLSGCSDLRIPEYEPVAFDLDGKSELYISTYPAGYPRTTSHIPFLYKTERSPESVFFQVFIRDRRKKAGPNTHVKSIRIHSFSYQIDNEAPVVLIADYGDYFWMQDQANDNNVERNPVPWVSGKPIAIDISLAVNGKDYAFKTRMQPAVTRSPGLILGRYLE